MIIGEYKRYASHGPGTFRREDFKGLGENVIIEEQVLVFHPENITLGSNVYVGHSTILKGYFKNEMRIGDHTWIGQGSFLHSGGGILIGKAVGIGPMVKILTSFHKEGSPDQPVMANEIEFAPVVIEDGCDIGTGSIILPGVHIGEGVIVGAGSVVTRDIPPFSVVSGSPARVTRKRKG